MIDTMRRVGGWRPTRPVMALGVAVVMLAVSFAAVGATAQPPQQPDGFEDHEAVFAEDRYPSATSCAPCHEDIYREWSVSSHAYAQMSPVFNAFHATVLLITNGTNGDFCIRCHNPVGMNLEEPEIMSNLDRNPTSREGVTCIACHRLSKAYGKISGRLPIVEGSIYAPVYGPTGDAELQRAIESGTFNLQTDPDRAGRAVHAEAREFFQLPTSGFCGTCHDVNLVNGFRLEEAFSEYKHSPAAANGVTCQDCHMASQPGVDSEFAVGPAARLGTRETRPRKRSNHMFAGPDYSIVHPGLFPHNTEAQALATLREWLTFDYRAGWGTDAFEDDVADTFEFPPRWVEPDDRYDAPPTFSGTIPSCSTTWRPSASRSCRRPTCSAMSRSTRRTHAGSSSRSSSGTTPTDMAHRPGSTRNGSSGWL